MDTHAYQPIIVNEELLKSLEEWANDGMLTATQVEKIMNWCGNIIKEMIRNQEAPLNHMGRAGKEEHLLRCIATLDRLHEAVKLNHERVNGN